MLKYKKWEDSLDIEFQYFYERYQNDELYKNLIHDDNYDDIKNILKTDKSNITNKDKLFLLLYVVYRYRNNIFHGNKGVRSWIKYIVQIEKCVKVMIIMLDK